MSMRLKTAGVIIFIVIAFVTVGFFLGPYFIKQDITAYIGNLLSDTEGSLPFAAFLSFIVGVIAAIYLARPVSRLFSKIEKMRKEIERRGRLLDTVNRAAVILLSNATNDKNFEYAFNDSMDIIGKNIEADRVQLWKNEMIDGSPHVILNHEWVSECGRELYHLKEQPIEIGLEVPYRTVPGWEQKFMRGGHINSPVKRLPPEERAFLEPFAIKSISVIPIFVDNKHWGLLSLNDYKIERTLSEEEVAILRGAGTMMAVAVDRAERERKIQDAQKYVKIMLEATPLACRIWNRDLRMLDCNNQALKLFGLKDKEDYKKRFTEISPEFQPDGKKSSEIQLDFLREAFEREGSHTYEWMFQTVNGELLPAEVTLVRVPYDGDFFVAGYTRDLREHKRIMADIEQRDALLYAVNHVAGILLHPEASDFSKVIGQCMEIMTKAVDADRMYIWKNYTENEKLYCIQIYEWFENVLSSRDCGVTSGVLYDDLAPYCKKVFLRGENVNSLVRDIPPSDRKMFAVQGILSILLVPIFTRDEFWGFVGFDNCHSERLFPKNDEFILQSTSLLITNALLRDEYIHDIQETSAKLEMAFAETQETSAKLEIALAETQEASARLEIALAETQEASAKLEIALGETRNANNAKSDFLANMSHEMRTPLNAVIGLADMTLAYGNLSGEAAANVEKIYNSGSMLLSIVNDILDISKIEAGKFDMIQNEYEVPSVVNDCVVQNIMRIGSKPIQFILNIDENMPMYLYGDALLLKRVINNLLSNAFKYTEKGTVELALECARDGDTVWLTIRVSDTGIGIKPEHLTRIFSDYAQFETMPSRRTEGTGLGLSITKKLADMMDGTVGIESEYGKGSVFTVKIRQGYVRDSVIGIEVLENLKNLRYHTGKGGRYSKLNRLKIPYASVLLVDDNLTNLDVAKGILLPYEMRVDCVTSGQEAVEAIREEKVKYNAIFMDHMMPVMDGIEATRIIREEIGTEYAKNIPIIAFTANAIMGNEEMFISKGFQAFIPKPIDMFRMDEVIRNWVCNPEEEATFLNLEEHAHDMRAEFGMRKFVNEIDGLDLLKGLERFYNEETFLHILRVYAVNTKPLLDALSGVNAETLPEYTITVHGIKSSSRGVGAEPLGNLAQALEYAAKAGDFDFVAQNNPAFLKTAWQLIKDIEAMLDNISKENVKPKKDKPDSVILTKLCFACENYDLSGINTAIEEIEQYEYTSDPVIAEWLRSNITQMNYTQIIEKLSLLIGD